MSESTNAYAAEPVEDAVIEEDEVVGNRRPLVLVGGVVLALALAGGAFLFLGGDDTEEELAPIKRAPRAAAAAPAVPAPVKLPPAFNAQLGRDPFKALYTAPVGGGIGAPAGAPAGGTTIVVQPGTGTTGTGTTGSGTTGTGTTGTGTTGSGTTGSGGAGSGSTGTGGSASPAPRAQSTIQLSAVKRPSSQNSKPVGTFVLDGKTLYGQPGDVLDGRLLVISLQQDATGSWFANLQVGDGQPFEVHERQTVVVPN